MTLFLILYKVKTSKLSEIVLKQSVTYSLSKILTIV